MSAVGQSDLVAPHKIMPAIIMFLVLTGLLSAAAHYFLIHHGLTRYYMGLLVICPALAVFIICKVQKLPISMVGWRWGSGRWALIGYAIPLLYGLIAYGIIWGAGYGGLIDGTYVKELTAFLRLSGWSDDAVVIFGTVMLATIGMLWNVPAALGEEIGWRGFLTPLLMRKFGFATTSLLVGLIWALWHMPLIFLTKYNAGPTDLEFQFLNYIVMCVGLSFVMSYVRLKSGSIWPCAILHAAHNILILNIMQAMTINYKETWRYAGEFGIVLPVVILVFGLYFWRLAHGAGLAKPLNR